MWRPLSTFMRGLADAPAPGGAIFQGDVDVEPFGKVTVLALHFLRRHAEDDAGWERRGDMRGIFRRARRFGQHLFHRLPGGIGLARKGLETEELGTGHHANPVAGKRNMDRLLRCKQRVGEGAAPLDPACGCAAADPSRIEAAGGGCKTRPPPAS